MIITISGNQGSGKTILAKKLAEFLNYDFISIGDLRGMIAQENNITIDELNEIGKKEDWVHKKADQKTIDIGKTKDNFVVEGWAAWHFIPHSKKIFLEVDPKVGTKRVFINQRPDEKKCNTLEEMKNLLDLRLKETKNAFKTYYGINFLDKKNYDIIIDSTNLTINEMLNKVIKKLK